MCESPDEILDQCFFCGRQLSEKSCLKCCDEYGFNFLIHRYHDNTIFISWSIKNCIYLVQFAPYGDLEIKVRVISPRQLDEKFACYLGYKFDLFELLTRAPPQIIPLDIMSIDLDKLKDKVKTYISFM
jgi:hypothetical protein